jgi:hypothetical protein
LWDSTGGEVSWETYVALREGEEFYDTMGNYDFKVGVAALQQCYDVHLTHLNMTKCSDETLNQYGTFLLWQSNGSHFCSIVKVHGHWWDLDSRMPNPLHLVHGVCFKVLRFHTMKFVWGVCNFPRIPHLQMLPHQHLIRTDFHPTFGVLNLFKKCCDSKDLHPLVQVPAASATEAVTPNQDTIHSTGLVDTPPTAASQEIASAPIRKRRAQIDCQQLLPKKG